MNSFGTFVNTCPLRYQTGDVAIQNFNRLIEQLPVDLRTAFENEREERRCELENYMADNEYLT